MPLSLDRYTETERHERLTSLKRLGVIAGFVFLLALLVANTFVLRRQLNAQVGHQDFVNHTRQVLFELERTQSLLKDVEIGHLGFLSTGDPKHPSDTTIVRAIIRLGQSLHLRVIAEGVETIEDIKFLKTQDCDEAQGYYFGHAVPAAQFTSLVQLS